MRQKGCMWSEMNNRRSHLQSWPGEGQVVVVVVAVAEGVEQQWERTCWVWIVDVDVVGDRNDHQKRPDYLGHMD